MATYERDPNALKALLGMQPQIPQYGEDDTALNDMISEEDLYQAQEKQADAGRARGGPYAVSSRESFRNSELANLKKMFGIQQAKNEASALPQRIAGEYGLARERERVGLGHRACPRISRPAVAASRRALPRCRPCVPHPAHGARP